MVLVRQEIGDVLRDFRLQKGRTLRQVASKASVALGYLSAVCYLWYDPIPLFGFPFLLPLSPDLY